VKTEGARHQRHRFRPAHGHDVHSPYALDCLHFVPDLAAEVEPGLFLVFRRKTLKPAKHPIWHVHTGDFVPQAVDDLERANRPDAGQDRDPFVQTQVDDPAHVLAEPAEVEDELGLNELRPGGDLLGQAEGSVFEGRRKGIGHGADEEARRPLRYRHTAFEDLSVAHEADHSHQVDGVDIGRRPGVGVIAATGVIAAQAHYVGDSEESGPQQLGLKPQSVTVATGELQHRLQTRLLEQDTGGETRGVDLRRLVVGDVEGIALAAKDLDLPTENLRVGAHGWRHLDRHGEMPALEDTLQSADRGGGLALAGHGSAGPLTMSAAEGTVGSPPKLTRSASRAKVTHDERPWSRQSAGGLRR
jgi:hypothetical protein